MYTAWESLNLSQDVLVPRQIVDTTRGAIGVVQAVKKIIFTSSTNIVSIISIISNFSMSITSIMEITNIHLAMYSRS